jgi:hypothetical protein
MVTSQEQLLPEAQEEAIRNFMNWLLKSQHHYIIVG